jgi:hypothetical protein
LSAFPIPDLEKIDSFGAGAFRSRFGLPLPAILDEENGCPRSFPSRNPL